MFKLDCSSNTEVVLLVGPSGVGKTILMAQIVESLCLANRPPWSVT
jgi:DNA replication protein DnaC